MVHGLKRQKKKKQLIWSWSRATASRKVTEVMKEAGIDGTQASAKGLRHGFGVACVEKQIPLNMVQKWLGHADMATTSIYVDAVGEEEQSIARRLWE
jgi:site-specific recombinase XerD